MFIILCTCISLSLSLSEVAPSNIVFVPRGLIWDDENDPYPYYVNTYFKVNVSC